MDLTTFTLQILMKLALLFLGYVEDMVTHQKALLATAFHTSCVDEMMETLHFIVPTIMVTETTSTLLIQMRWQGPQVQMDGPLKGLHAMLEEVECRTLYSQRRKLSSIILVNTQTMI